MIIACLLLCLINKCHTSIHWNQLEQWFDISELFPARLHIHSFRHLTILRKCQVARHERCRQSSLVKTISPFLSPRRLRAKSARVDLLMYFACGLEDKVTLFCYLLSYSVRVVYHGSQCTCHPYLWFSITKTLSTFKFFANFRLHISFFLFSRLKMFVSLCE